MLFNPFEIVPHFTLAPQIHPVNPAAVTNDIEPPPGHQIIGLHQSVSDTGFVIGFAHYHGRRRLEYSQASIIPEIASIFQSATHLILSRAVNGIVEVENFDSVNITQVYSTGGSPPDGGSHPLRRPMVALLGCELKTGLALEKRGSRHHRHIGDYIIDVAMIRLVRPRGNTIAYNKYHTNWQDTE
jgi:hypothetical protein